jgi:predicted PurR-regulated permease PerM
VDGERTPLRARLRRLGREEKPSESEEEYVELDPAELTGIFSAPSWLRDLGFTSWLLVGVAAALAGAIWLAAATQTILMPVLTAAIIASVASPLVDKLQRRSVPRFAGALLVFLAITALGVGVGILILNGIESQAAALSERLRDGADQLESWAKDLGVDTDAAADAKAGADGGIADAFGALTSGLAAGLDRLASLAVFLSFTALALFFMLKDAPAIGDFVVRHVGLPVPAARAMIGRVAGSLRGYFVGVTIVALWSALIVGLGSLLIGVPMAGTIAVVTFLGGYIPYLGAWTAGAFAVLVALGASGPEAAGAMAVLCLLANGVLQQMVQPIAYGAALGLHPLAVLIVTIAGGCLFGTIGLVLAAPLLSAAVKISADLTAGRKREEAGGTESEPPSAASPDPAPA